MDAVPIIPISSTRMPCRSRRVVKQPGWFMYLGKSFEVILKEHDINPIDYDKAMSNVDAHLQQKAMKVELESLWL